MTPDKVADLIEAGLYALIGLAAIIGMWYVTVWCIEEWEYRQWLKHKQIASSQPRGPTNKFES